ncbi:MAG: hypothetical protein AB1798_24095, partial [Spirochaetota bacterium]
YSDTRLIILDEPTWGIDLQGEATLLESLRYIIDNIKKASILIISHDLSFISRLHSEILWLIRGCIRYYSTIEELRQALKFSNHFI